MIQMTTILDVADNSRRQEGACASRCSAARRRRTPSIGDVIVVSIKEAIPNAKVKKGEVAKAVIVRTKREVVAPGRQLHPFDDELGRARSTRTTSRSAPASSGRSLASCAPSSS